MAVVLGVAALASTARAETVTIERHVEWSPFCSCICIAPRYRLNFYSQPNNVAIGSAYTEAEPAWCSPYMREVSFALDAAHPTDASGAGVASSTGCPLPSTINHAWLKTACVLTDAVDTTMILAVQSNTSCCVGTIADSGPESFWGLGPAFEHRRLTAISGSLTLASAHCDPPATCLHLTADITLNLTFADEACLECGPCRACARCLGPDANGNDLPDPCENLPCSADTNGDGTVGFADVLGVIGAWGTPDPAYDINLDGDVTFGDLLDLIGQWGPCA